MDSEAKAPEPPYVQVPTADLRRILSERFAQEVSSAAWGRMWRALTFIGVPSLAVLVSLLWGALDVMVKGRVTEAGEKAEAKIKEEVKREIAVIADQVPNRVRDAFNDQSGQAVQEKLRAALEAPSFQAFMQGKIHGVVEDVWKGQKEQLRLGFLAQVTQEQAFLQAFAKQVADAMTQSRAVPGFIAESMEASLRGARPEDTGRMSALDLLAAMDQSRANAVVSHLLEESNRHGLREMALRGLRHVRFDGVPVAPGDAAKMLETALAAWSAHCSAVPCDADAAPTRAMESFLARGRQLPANESAIWVSMLRLWHEEVVRGEGRARKASLHLVPRALGAIGSPEARDTLVRWFTSGTTDLALSAATAVGGQAAASLGDAERLALFKSLWPTGAAPEARRAVLAEAEWMALGRVSDGRADPAGAFRPEALSVLARPPQAAGRPAIARWAAPRSVELDRQRALLPPAEPCAVGTDAPSQHRVELCALAALIRPERGAVEWGELRRVTPWEEDEVGVLALLWTIAASRAAEGAPGAEARLAPLPDLLRMRAPAPAVWQLAAMLLLRTAPEQTAWQALRQLRPTADDAPMFVAASRWLFRPWSVAQAWFVEELRGLPAPVRSAVLRDLLAAALPKAEAETGDPLPPLVRRLSSPGLAALNALAFAHATGADAALAAVEREDGLRRLQESAAGGASGGAAQAAVAGDLLAALLDRAGWSRAVVAMAAEAAEAPLAGPKTPLTASFEGRFGRLRLNGGDTLALEPSEAARGHGGFAPVTFYNPRTRETRVLGPRATWRLPGSGAEGWLFRLGAERPALQLLATPAEGLAPAASASSPALPSIEEGRVYNVRALPADPDRAGHHLAGWARVAWVRAGDRVRLSTFDLAENVDTVVEVHGDAAELEAQDVDGDGLASGLEWTADRTGEVLVRLVNIGAPGAFRLKAERLPRAPDAAAATDRVRPVSQAGRPR